MGCHKPRMKNWKTSRIWQINWTFLHSKHWMPCRHRLPAKSGAAPPVLRRVIMNLEDAGLHVVAVMTDNNSINKKVMSMFGESNEPSIVYPHPAKQEQPLFHIVDTVPLLKCIRNNWLNQKNCDKCLYYPPFEREQQGGKMQGASFTSLKKLYEAEQDSVVKVSYGLTYKSLNPTNQERQNVRLALKIFSSFVSSALRLKGTELKLTLPEETAGFIDLILRWWNIVNVKTPQKGKRLRDPWQEPISAMCCQQLEFLDKFVTWLDNWKNEGLQTGTLTRETHSALRLSTYALIEVSHYCLDELGFKYVLLGKFQTDALEARFGKYRRLCGSHYNVSITQVLEAETKIRIQSTLHLTDFPEYSKQEKEPCAEFLIKKYKVSLSESEIKKPREDMPALVYIAGFHAHAALRRHPCDDCSSQLTIKEREVKPSDHVLIDDMSRGGLKFPEPCIVHAVLCTKIVLQQLTAMECEHLFHAESNQRLVLLSIMKFLLADSEDIDVCASGHYPDFVRENILKPAINTLLKNYAATRNDAITRKQGHAKLSNQRKLQTLK